MNVVIIKHLPSGKFVERIDPVTMRATGEPQQFDKRDDGQLMILPKRQWVDYPEEITVGSWHTA